MRTETIFYIFGGFFAIAALVYFTWEYIITFPKSIKAVLLLCITIIVFYSAELLKERNI